jgi:hypothetical protein
MGDNEKRTYELAVAFSTLSACVRTVLVDSPLVVLTEEHSPELSTYTLKNGLGDVGAIRVRQITASSSELDFVLPPPQDPKHLFLELYEIDEMASVALYYERSADWTDPVWYIPDPKPFTFPKGRDRLIRQIQSQIWSDIQKRLPDDALPEHATGTNGARSDQQKERIAPTRPANLRQWKSIWPTVRGLVRLGKSLDEMRGQLAKTEMWCPGDDTLRKMIEAGEAHELDD